MRRPWPAIADDPAEEAERFFRRMMGDSSWDRLSDQARQSRRDDGVALVADLESIRGPVPYDLTRLEVASVFGRGGVHSAPHHRETVAWLATNVPGTELFEIEGATHGAHLSHPDGFAAFVRATVDAGRRTDRRAGSPLAEGVARP
jgi:pimeloyl-ACP methyl ester carboxylesterase